jgi:hypothetical protein
MARFFGKVGYGVPGELVAGVWSDSIVERDYYGKYLNETVSSEESDKVNADLRLSSRISIVADPFALGHFSTIKYVIDEGGVYWAVTSVELKRPRLILSTGGVYNGPKPSPGP